MANEYFYALLNVATAVNSSLETAVVLHKITEVTAKALNCKASTLRLLDRSGEVLLASAAYGLSAGYMRKGTLKVADSALDAEVLSGKVIHLVDASSDSRFHYTANAKAEGLASVLTAPLMYENKAIGLLRVYTDGPREFTEDEIAFMKGVANISAIAIENARLHEASRVEFELLTSYNYQVFED